MFFVLSSYFLIFSSFVLMMGYISLNLFFLTVFFLIGAKMLVRTICDILCIPVFFLLMPSFEPFQLLSLEEPWTLILDDVLANSFIAPLTDDIKDDHQLTCKFFIPIIGAVCFVLVISSPAPLLLH